MHLNTSRITSVVATVARQHTMKICRTPSALELCSESADGLLDIFSIGANALEDHTPEADARNLRYDLQQIGEDFRQVMSEIGSGTCNE
jgi:hypothetical protein